MLSHKTKYFLSFQFLK